MDLCVKQKNSGRNTRLFVKMSSNNNTFMTTVQIFLWKHWKCFQCSWIKNVFMIVVPIAIAWFQIHVSSATTKGSQSTFQTITEVIFSRAIPKISLFVCVCVLFWLEFISSGGLPYRIASNANAISFRIKPMALFMQMKWTQSTKYLSLGA